VNLRALRWVSALANLAALFVSINIGSASANAKSPGLDARRRDLCWILFAVCIWFEPVQQTLRFGQVNLFLMAAVLADLVRPENSRWRGAFVGIAAGIKLTPAIFLLFLVVTGQRRDAKRGICAAAATVVLGWLILPRASNAFWVDHRFAQSSRVGNIHFVANQSIFGAIARLFGGRFAVPSLYFPLAATLLMVGLGQAARLHRSGQVVPAICWCGLTGLLVSPISWSHHWVWAVPFVAWATSTAGARRRGRALLGVGVSAVFLAWPMHSGSSVMMPFGVIWLTPRTARLGRTWGLPWFTGNFYVLIALVAMVALEVWQRHAESRDTSHAIRAAASMASSSRKDILGLEPRPGG
jgi:alpha-1,2-mannosyltransferase